MNKGFVMLLSVLLLAIIGVALSTTLVTLSVTNTQSAGILHDGEQAKNIAGDCAEVGLQQIVNLISYTGSGSQTIGSSNCVYTVTNTSASLDTVTGQGTTNQAIRKVVVTVAIPSRSIVTWQEVGDF